MRSWISVLFLMGGVSAVTAFIVVSLMTADDCKTFSGAPAIAEYQGDGKYLLEFGGGNKTSLDSGGYIKYLEGVVEYISGELDSLETEDRYVAVLMTANRLPEMVAQMGLRLPDGAKLKYSERFISQTGPDGKEVHYLDSRNLQKIEYGLLTFRYPRGEFPQIEVLNPPNTEPRFILSNIH